MQLDSTLCAHRRTRTSSAGRLRRAVLVLTENAARVASHSEAAWASITFAGTRHTMTLEFAGDDAVAAGEAFIAALPDHEFDLPGTLVADASVRAATHRLLPDPALSVEIELLLLDEG